MGKHLTQITFDFSAPPDPVPEPEKEVVSSTEASADEVLPEIIGADEEEVISFVSKADPSVSPVTTVKERKPLSNRGRRSLKDTGLPPEHLSIPDDEELFRKQYYSIGEVAGMFSEKQSLIRYWETEFDILQPRKNKKGDRFFRPVDVKNLALIYDLLRRRKFTIEGAKDFLRKNKKADERFEMIRSLERMRQFFLELKAGL